jgi:hypothetical protein
MTLTEPRDALADQSSLIDYLMGLAGLARVVRGLADDGVEATGSRGTAGEFVDVLLGVARLGEAIELLAGDSGANEATEAGSANSPNVRWLR